MDPKIENFFLKLSEPKRQLALEVRNLILSANPNVAETIKWNQLTFVCGKTNLAFVYTYPKVDYINLGFTQATSLSDPKNLFEGTGKGMRHIKIRSSKDIPAKQVKSWVKEAVELAG